MAGSVWEQIKSIFGLKEDKEAQDAILNLRRISDQAALLQNLDKILINEVYTTAITEGSSPLVAGIDIEEPELTVNKLYNYKNFIKTYNKLTSADLSNLVPFIKIYKIYPDNFNKSPQLIPFNNFFPKDAQDQILLNGSDRGFQANITNVEFRSQGKDTETTFIYEVKIGFIFDSVATIFSTRSIYTELFNPPKKVVEELKNVREYKQEYYQLMLDFGWEGNTESIPEISLNNKELREFIEYSKNKIFLNYIKHSININEDGSVKLDITYIGALEMESRNPANTDVISPEVIQNIKKIREEIEIQEQKIKDKDSKAIIETIMEDDGEQIKEIKILVDGKEKDGFKNEKANLEKKYKELYSLTTQSIKDFENTLINRIYWQYNGILPKLVLDWTGYQSARKIIEDYSSYTEYGKLDLPKKIKELIGDTNPSKKPKIVIETDEKVGMAKCDIKDTFRELNERENLGEYEISYFTFGTLIKALSLTDKFLFLGSNCQLAFFSPDSGLLSVKDFANHNPNKKVFIENNLSDTKVAVYANEIKNLNIFEIPIAASTFAYWFNKNFLKQNISSLTLINFLNRCINELLPLCVRPDNLDFFPKQNIKFKFFFDKVELNSNNTLLRSVEFLNEYKRPSANLKYKLNYNNYSLLEEQLSNDKKQKNIIILYSTPTYVSRKKNIATDLENGIPYFFYGASNTIVNKITFREENIPFFKEANIQTQVDKKDWRPGVFIRSKYNVLIECLGTVNFRIGSLIYISPSFTGVIDVDEPIKYGIGGYFVIISIITSIESGKYVTSIEANWVATGTGEYTDLTHKGITLIKLSKPLEELIQEKERDILFEKIDAEQRKTTPAGFKKGTL